MSKNTQDMNNKSGLRDIFFNFYFIFFMAGLASIVVSYLIQSRLYPLLISLPLLLHIAKFSVLTFNTLGAALIIASVFNYTIESTKFLNYVRNRISEIIISKDFLKNLNHDSKKEALALILKPTDSQKSVFSGIEDYFHEYIEKSLRLFETNFRSHLTLDFVASYDVSKDKIRLDQKISYRTYRMSGDYEAIIMSYEKGEESVINSITINGKAIEPEVKERKDTGTTWTTYMIPQKHVEERYLVCTQDSTSYGYSTWQNYFFRLSKPCDGISITLTCEGDVNLQEYMIKIRTILYKKIAKNPFIFFAHNG